MFSRIESELSRGFLQAAKGKIGPPLPSKATKPELCLSGSGPKGSRSCCSQGSCAAERDRVGGVRMLQDPGKVPALSTSWIGDQLHPATRSFVRGYASARSNQKPPSQSGQQQGGLPTAGQGGEVSAFMKAKPFEEIPGPTSLPQSIPFATSRLLYYPFTNYPAENISHMIDEMQSTYGPIMKIKFATEWLVIIDDLADIEKVVKEAEQEYTNVQAPSLEKSGLMNRLSKGVVDSALSWLGWKSKSPQPTGNVVNEILDGVPVWLEGNAQSQKLRATMARHINTQLTTGSYLSRQEELAKDLAKCVQQVHHNPKDLQTLFYRYSIESVSQRCFSNKLGLLKDPQLRDEEKRRLVEGYRTMVRCLGETLTGAGVLQLLYQDPMAKRFKEAKQIVYDWEESMMRGQPSKQDKGAGAVAASPEDRSLLLTLLEDKSLEEKAIFEAMHALMTIGSDSVATTLQMLLYSLAQNADKQEKLVAEIQANATDGKMTPASLQAMTYLKASIKESLRLHFPMAAGGRVTLSKNLVLQDYLVPAGTPIVVNSRRTAKNPVWFDHPNYYRPERWLGEDAKKIPVLAFMPFGFGANHCPSRAFSLQEVNVAIIKLLQQYKVTLPGEYLHRPLETTYSLFLSPREPLPFYFMPHSEARSRKEKSER